MQQKCDAWREEVEKLSPLRNEVAGLRQENARLQQELAEATEDITKLKRELQEMSDARQKVACLVKLAVITCNTYIGLYLYHVV